MDAGMSQVAECIVKKKIEGPYKVVRVLLILGYILIPIPLFFAVAKITLGLYFLIGIIPVFYLILLPKVIIPLTYKYLKIEYECSIVTDELTVTKILDGKSRKEILTLPLQKASLVCPLTDETAPRADTPDIERAIFAVSSMSDDGIYYILFTDEDGDKSVLFFQPTPKMLSLIKRANRSATRDIPE